MEATEIARYGAGSNPTGENSNPHEIRPSAGTAGSTGSPGESPLPRAQQVELAELLDTVHAHLKRYVYVVHEKDYVTLTLYILHTWLVNESNTTPRLLIHSPVPGSGKTTLLEHLEKLCLKPVRLSNAASPAALTRLLLAGTRTLLLDEADRTLDPRREGIGDLFAVINTGYKSGGCRLTIEPDGKGGWHELELPTYAPVVIAGNTPHLPDDTRERCISVLLLKDTQGRIEESDWEFVEAPTLDLRERIEQAVEHLREPIQRFRPELPTNCTNRNKERWLPLMQVAALAGSEWGERAWTAIVADLEHKEREREELAATVKPAVQLVLDLYEIYGDEHEFLGTQDLIERLQRHNPELWRNGNAKYPTPLNPQRMGQMLWRNYQISADSSRRPRGYFRAQFEQAWESNGLTPRGNRQNRQNRLEPDKDKAETPIGSEQQGVAKPVPLLCQVCGQLMSEATRREGTHPNCDPHLTKGNYA
jgi:hypothetical protein